MMQTAPDAISIPSGNAILQVYFYPRPQADTIIMLHGGPGVPDEMTEVRDWLCQNMQVIHFNQRGVDEKDCKGCTFTMDDFVNDINHIAAWFQISRFHLFGHSWGGLYAQIYAHFYPQNVSSLFLCSPASGTGKEWKITEREIFHYNISRSTLPEIFAMACNTILGMVGNKAAYRRLFRQIIINYHKGYSVDPPDEEKLRKINSKAGLYTRKEIRNYPELGIFGKTSYPVIITYGQFDAYGPSKKFVLDRFPDAAKVTIPKSGHTPWKHNWPEFMRILNAFYAGMMNR